MLPFVIFAHSLLAENWPGWRGPRGDGTSLEKNIPTEWSAIKNIAWKTLIPGKSHASPIVWEDLVFVVTCIEEEQERRLLCVDRIQGIVIWQKLVAKSPLERVHRLNSPASSTPATNGKLVYVSFLDVKEMVVAAFDFQGNRKWQVRPGVFSSVHGYSRSPVIWNDKLIVNGDHDGPSYIVGLERKSGKNTWAGEKLGRGAYASLVSADGLVYFTFDDGTTRLIRAGKALDIVTENSIGERVFASPAISQGQIFIKGDHHLFCIGK